MLLCSSASAEDLYMQVGKTTSQPIGWTQFCVEYKPECKTKPTQALWVVLSAQSLIDLNEVNRWVNKNIKPITDLEHWGVVERWNYPDDGYGDCEDYALAKRRMLIEAGWPRSALLMSVVRDMNGDGHAVLTVETNHGEFVLDNQRDDILLWSNTGYRFAKRQSQSDPNVWVSIVRAQDLTATVPSSK